jgi:mRNA interferase RelE/StbE
MPSWGLALPGVFHNKGQLYLPGYTLEEGVRLIYLEAVGPHENFYRDLRVK